jgi:uncharacterized OB-fold protein
MEIPRHWRLKQQRYSLNGRVCPHCEYKIFPPRSVCPNCGGDLNQTPAGASRVDAYTMVYKPSAKEMSISALVEERVAA